MARGGLNHALEALLYKTATREAFLARDIAQPDWSNDDIEALRAIDPEQLLMAAKLTRQHVLTKCHRGVGSLVQVFAGTIASWLEENSAQNIDALARHFVDSLHFDAYRAHPFSGRGISLEEAFFRFASDAKIGHANTCLRECALAIVRGLAVTPDPAFDLPVFIHRAPKGYFVVLNEGPTLLAALGTNFVQGPITPFVAAILTGSSRANDPDEVAVLDAHQREAINNELVGLGLIEA